jgi:hypothetical protein
VLNAFFLFQHDQLIYRAELACSFQPFRRHPAEVHAGGEAGSVVPHFFPTGGFDTIKYNAQILSTHVEKLDFYMGALR